MYRTVYKVVKPKCGLYRVCVCLCVCERLVRFVPNVVQRGKCGLYQISLSQVCENEKACVGVGVTSFHPF